MPLAAIAGWPARAGTSQFFVGSHALEEPWLVLIRMRNGRSAPGS